VKRCRACGGGCRFFTHTEIAMKTLFTLLVPLAFIAACSQEPAPAPAVNTAHEHAKGDEHAGHDKPAANHADHKSNDSAPTDEHASHGKITFNWDELKPPAPAGELVDLKNTNDPVTLKPIEKPGVITVEYKGYRVHFETEATRAKFNRKSLKYLNSLSLEPRVDGSVKHVDAANWIDRAPDKCPFMEDSEIDPHGQVYLLHRGFKIFFCCWTGCGDGFMQDPSKVYDYYGLVEKDGKLQLK